MLEKTKKSVDTFIIIIIFLVRLTMPPKRKPSTRKKKLVGSPSPVGSPLFESPTPLSDAATGIFESDERSTSSEQDGGLSLPLQKELAEDIEQNGGLEAFVRKPELKTLALFLDTKPEVYGVRGDNIRRQIQNRVGKWKEFFKRGTYVKRVLEVLEVKSFQQRQAIGLVPLGPSKTSDEAEDSSLSSSGGSSGSDSDAGTIDRSVARSGARKKPKKTKLTPTPRKLLEHTEPPTRPERIDTFIEDLSSKVSEVAMTSPRRDLAIPSDATIIRVNSHHPEKNGPFTIVSVNDIEGVQKNKVYPGFAVLMETDIRYSVDSASDNIEYFTATVFAPNKVLIRVPAWDYCLLSSSDRSSLAKKLKPNIMNAIDDARNKFNSEKEERMWRHYVLEFDSYVQLSATVIFDQAGDEESLPRSIVPFVYTVANMVKTNAKHFFVFYVARTEEGAKQFGVSNTNRTLTASALDELGIGGGLY